jgi:hypothetical protein
MVVEWDLYLAEGISGFTSNILTTSRDGTNKQRKSFLYELSLWSHAAGQARKLEKRVLNNCLLQ